MSYIYERPRAKATNRSQATRPSYPYLGSPRLAVAVSPDKQSLTSPAMLYSVELLCSVIAAFARLAHVLGRTVMSLCSPKFSAAGVVAPAAAWGSGAKKVHPVAIVAVSHLLEIERQQQGPTDGQQLMLASPLSPSPPVLVLPATFMKGEKVDQEQRTKTARARPPRLVIPPAPVLVAARGGIVDPFGEAAGRATDVPTELEVKGEGFCMASRRGVRHAMEDGYEVITNHKIGGGSQLAFYGVYDGHGGRAAVDFVADRLGKNVVAVVSASSAAAATTSPTTSSQQQRPAGGRDQDHDDDDVTAAIRVAYLSTDSEFLSQGVRGGACAATALVKDGQLYVSNVGDCRAVLGSRGGVATALTSDQIPGREDERLRIENAGGYVSCGAGSGVWRVQDSLAVSRAFGDAGVKPWVTCEPETTSLRITADCRFVVLASDGLWCKVSNQEAVDTVTSASAAGADVVPGTDPCKALVSMARSRGSRDDITVMVVDLQRFLPVHSSIDTREEILM
ncbi:hypothetical protein GUJ93_ZPchr0009g2143 [Zizania palustris]|uniref:protein-serine/threonine phosphatase n=1 Tax=Zizania palustris TaxID=103762 RepID=A0A8J5R4N5_ZIZPA|nr:hypothetical protein GUJ93_ZPchr0009g2143 [Zizania palustris]